MLYPPVADMLKNVESRYLLVNVVASRARVISDEAEALQEELEAREYDVSAGGGVVNVKINGKKEILSVKIDPEVVDPDDVETLEDLIVAAVNEAIKRVEDTNSAEMSKVTGNMSMPGLF